MSEGRLIFLYLVFVTGFCIVLLSLFFISSNLTYSEMAGKQSRAVITLSKGRGEIYDYKLNPLTSVKSKVYALAVSGQDAYAEYFRSLDSSDQAKAYELYDKKTPYLIELAQNSPKGDFEFLGEARYLNEQPAAHIIGYLDNSGTGVQGVERAFDTLLKEGGVVKNVSYYKGALGEIMQNNKPSILRFDGTGEGIVLTIDTVIQRICEGIAKNIKKGSIVVLETSTGRVKAAVSMPALYPSNIIKNLLDNDGAFINRSAAAFNVGSVIKPLIAAALLDNGLDKEEIYTCYGSIEVSGHTYRCYSLYGHGEVNLERAIEVSCNTYFINYGLQVPPQILAEFGRNVGFGNKLSIGDYTVSVKGRLPSATELSRIGERASFCFGQGLVTATPIQIAAMMNIFATGGVYISPTLIEGIYNQFSNEITESFYSPVIKRVLPQQDANVINKALCLAVSDGIAKNAQPLNATAAGKTGTAQTGRLIAIEEQTAQQISKGEPVDETVAWFCGYYPAQNPKYTIVVMQDASSLMGEAMCEIFAKICNKLCYYDEELLYAS